MDGEFDATAADMFSESSVSGITDDQAAEYLANSQVLPEMDTSNTKDGEIDTTQDTAGTGDQTLEYGPFLPEIEWISSTRGTGKPFVNGYPFSKDKVSKADPDLVFWHCDSFRDKTGKCRVRLHTNGREFLNLVGGEHNHQTDDNALILRGAKSAVKDRAKNTLEKPLTILNSVTCDMAVGSSVKLDKSAVRKQVRRIRTKDVVCIPEAKNVESIVIPDECKYYMDANGKRELFILADSGFGDSERSNQEFAVKARMLMSLVFVPPANVRAIFEELKTDLGVQMMRKLSPIFTWFKKYYIGAPGREAMFSIALWTAYERTLAGEDRTNNFAEAAHRKLQSLFGVDHPSLGNFLDRLKNAQKSHDRTYEEYVMGKPPQKKRRKYLDADKRILNLVNSFEGRNTVQGRMEYLKGLKTRKYLAGLGFVILVIIAIAITARFYFYEDHPEEPPILEEPKSESTLVTAFFALGPPNSATFKINLERYHSYMLQVLQLRLPLVMFTNEHSIDFVHKTRKAAGLENFTKVYNIGLHDLPLFKQYELFHDILYQEQKGRTWKPHWNVALKDRPETASVEYMMLENSKSFFLINASTENSFNTTHFMWLDANYGHGNSSVFPYNYEWTPEFEEGKISILKLAPTNDSITLYNKDKLYRQNITLVGGEFLAGDARTIDKFHKAYERKIVDIAYNDRMVDDDETMLVILINEMPELFNVMQGEWFNVFHLF